MKTLWAFLLVFILFTASAEAKRHDNRHRENRLPRPAMSEAHSRINDSLDIQEKISRNAAREQRRTQRMVEDANYNHEQALRNGERYRRNKKTRRNF